MIDLIILNEMRDPKIDSTFYDLELAQEMINK